jgi:hypothetical protein
MPIAAEFLTEKNKKFSIKDWNYHKIYDIINGDVGFKVIIYN